MRSMKRALSICCILAAPLLAACGVTDFPVSPTPVANAPVTTVAGGSWSGSIILGDGSISSFNMTLIARGLGATAQQAPGTTEVTGRFETGSGVRGTVAGMLLGTLQNGRFEGTLTAESPACTRGYAGPITESTVAWVPTGSLPPNCAFSFSIQLPRPRGPECQVLGRADPADVLGKRRNGRIAHQHRHGVQLGGGVAG